MSQFLTNFGSVAGLNTRTQFGSGAKSQNRIILASQEARVLIAFPESGEASLSELAISTLETPSEVARGLTGLLEKELVIELRAPTPLPVVELTETGTRVRRILQPGREGARFGGRSNIRLEVVVVPDEGSSGELGGANLDAVDLDRPLEQAIEDLR